MHGRGTKSSPDFTKNYTKTDTKWADKDNPGDLDTLKEFAQKNQKLDEYITLVMMNGDCGKDNMKGLNEFWNSQFEFEKTDLQK